MRLPRMARVGAPRDGEHGAKDDRRRAEARSPPRAPRAAHRARSLASATSASCGPTPRVPTLPGRPHRGHRAGAGAARTVGKLWSRVKRLVIGAPLSTAQGVHERIPKVKALAVFASDALSSSAYATEEILLALMLPARPRSRTPCQSPWRSRSSWPSWPPPTGRPSTSTPRAAAPTSSRATTWATAGAGRRLVAPGRLRAYRGGEHQRRRGGDDFGRASAAFLSGAPSRVFRRLHDAR